MAGMAAAPTEMETFDVVFVVVETDVVGWERLVRAAAQRCRVRLYVALRGAVMESTCEGTLEVFRRVFDSCCDAGRATLDVVPLCGATGWSGGFGGLGDAVHAVGGCAVVPPGEPFVGAALLDLPAVPPLPPVAYVPCRGESVGVHDAVAVGGTFDRLHGGHPGPSHARDVFCWRSKTETGPFRVVR